MGKLILVRHGQTEMNANKLYFGRLDPPLNELGISQAKITKNKLINFDLKYDNIFSSPLLRAKKTAEICNYLDRPIIYSNDLKELNFGIFEGFNYSEICEKFPKEVEKSEKEWKTYNFETGESPEAMYERVIKFLRTLDFKKDTMIVSHWGVLCSILSHYLGSGLDSYWKFKIDNAGIAVLEGDFEFCYLTKFI